MTEFELIRLLTADLPGNRQTILGPGDDCAVLDLGLPDRWVLFKTDAVVEDVHYTKNSPPEKVGHKALARCLSDIAAMAGQPTSALVTLALPRQHDVEWVKAVYAGMRALAARYDTAIVGGETTTDPDRTWLSISVIGLVDKTRCIRRSGAKAGDAVFVTGDLGGSILGKHLEFEPRLREAGWLAANFSLRAMIDVSDGLAGDLRHLLEASHAGAELLAEAIPISRAARERARDATHPKPALASALSDGEDFELLFTLPAREAVRLMDAWKTQFPELRLSCIGKITETPGLHLRERQHVREITEHGYTHFA